MILVWKIRLVEFTGLLNREQVLYQRLKLSNIGFYSKTESKVDTANTSLVVWPLPYACAQPGNAATIDSCFSPYRAHQHGIADT